MTQPALRQAYLLRLSDALRPLSNPLELQAAVTRLTMEFFAATRCYYCEIVDENAVIRQDAAVDGHPSLAGTYPLSQFPTFRAMVNTGRPFVVPDVNTAVGLNEQLSAHCVGMRVMSFLNVTVVKAGVPVGMLSLTHDTPRRWTALETELAQDAAERAWGAVEHARAIEALRDSEARFKSIADLVPDMLWRSDNAWQIVWHNRRWLEYTGQGLDQALGHGWLEAVYPEDREPSVAQFGRVVEDSATLDLEFRVQGKDGVYRWFLARAEPQRDPAGQATVWYGAITDIHARRSAEVGLLESQRHYREIVAKVRDHAIIHLNLMGTVTACDGQVGEVTGYSSGALVGTDFRLLFTPEDRAAGVPDQELETARREGSALDDRWMQRRDRRRFWALGVLSVTRDHNGTVNGYTKVMRDETEARHHEERLQEINEAQRRFVSDAAHELRTPLTAIRGNLSLLRRFPNTPEDDRLEMLNDAERESTRLTRLIADLLSLARGESHTEVEPADVPLDRLLEEAWRGVRSLSERRRFDLGLLEPLVVHGDPDALKQLVLILLENAVKYSPEDGIVRLEVTGRDGWAQVRVANEGAGIAPADLERVFERFYRTDKARSRSGGATGTGLGLTIARQIVERHGGRIWLENAAESGMTVAVVQLPLRDTIERAVN